MVLSENLCYKTCFDDDSVDSSVSNVRLYIFQSVISGHGDKLEGFAID